MRSNSADFHAASSIVGQIKVPSVRQALEALVADARRRADQLDDEVMVATKAIEDWFNDRMARAGGWYKRKAQVIAFVLAGMVVGLTNADSIQVATSLWHDSSLRATIVEQAKTYREGSERGELRPLGVQPPLVELQPFPIGWSIAPSGAKDVVIKIAGLLLTTIAVSLGSGVWFELLGRLLQLRGTGPRVSTATGTIETKEA